MTHITFDPYIPLALWAPLALAAAALLAWYAAAGRRRLPARRWWPIVALMGVAVAVPLLILLNPTWIERIPPPAGKPMLTILLDRSASMATRDAPDGATRYEAGAAMAAAVARDLKDQYDVQLRLFAEKSAAVAPDALVGQKPDGAGTDLAEALQGVFDEDRPQGQAVLLLSDGVHNCGGADRLRECAVKARAMAAPVYAKTIGGPAVVNDLEVSLGQPQKLAFVGQRVPLVVSLRQRGSLGTKTAVSLLRGKEVVERRDVALKPDDAVEEVFYVSQDKCGLYRYDVRAEALPKESVAVNNSAPLLLRVIDQPVRVLLLEGKPYWDTKFLVRTLASDPSVELTCVIQIAEGRLLRRVIPRPEPAAEGKQPPSPPAHLPKGEGSDKPSPAGEQWKIESDPGKLLADAKSLASYQIVILGRNAEVFLTDDALATLRRWLAEGEGSLVCFRGPPTAQVGERLGELMPFRWEPAPETRFGVQLAGPAKAMHWLPPAKDGGNPLAELPSLASASRPEAVKALSTVLATGVGGDPKQSPPVITYHPVGTGRVVVVEGAGMWRWAFLPPDRQKQEEIYGTIWQSLLHWLSTHVGLLPSQRMALRTDALTFTTDENAMATLLVREWSGDPPRVELSGEALEKPRTFACVPHGNYPGQYQVGMGRLTEGRYDLRVLGVDADDLSSRAAFDVRGRMAERLDVRAQPAVMQFLAGESGGAVIENVEPNRLAREFQEHLVRAWPPRTARTMAWDRWWFLSGALLLWGAAWGLRRRSGLV